MNQGYNKFPDFHKPKQGKQKVPLVLNTEASVLFRVQTVLESIITDTDNALFFDTETTGISKNDEILQMAGVVNTGETIIRTYLQHAQPINSRAMAVHGIKKVPESSPTIIEIHDELRQCLESKLIVGANISFDIRMLKQTLELWKLDSCWVDQLETIDILQELKPLVGRKAKQEELFKFFDCAKESGFESMENSFHDAIGDARALLVLCTKVLVVVNEALEKLTPNSSE